MLNKYDEIFIFYILGILGKNLTMLLYHSDEAYKEKIDEDSQESGECMLMSVWTCSASYPSRKHAYIILTPINPTFI